MWAASTAVAAAADDKSQYTLFNPTPDRLLRDPTTDRPDMTESPFTVDAGRFGTRDPRGEIVIVAAGVAYQLTKNLQFDAGINIGVTDAADRINPFVGVSMRF